MTHVHDNEHRHSARIEREWPTLLAQLQLEALARLDRQFHRLTSLQRDIERLRAMHLEGYDTLAMPETRQVLRMLAASVQSLVDDAKSAPETFADLQECVRTLMEITSIVDEPAEHLTRHGTR